MINATIMSFDALLGCGQIVTDSGQILTLPYSAIVGRDYDSVLPSERDWRWLDRIVGLQCKIKLNNSLFGSVIHTCVIKNAPRVAA